MQEHRQSELAMNDPKIDRMIAGVIAGEAEAAAQFRADFHPELEAKLLSKCGATDGDARDEAREIAASLISLCCAGGGASKLKRYGGRCPLGAWLFLVAMRRLIDFFNARTKNPKITIDDPDTAAAKVPAALITEVEMNDVIGLMVQQALWHAMQALKQDDPEALVWLRMVHLHGVEQQVLAALWERDPGMISRRIKAACASLREETLAWLRDLDPHLDTHLDDYCRAIALHMRLVHGDTEEEAEVQGLA